MRNKKVAAVALAMLVAVSSMSLAYFTDRVESNFAAEAGTLCLTQVDHHQQLDNMAPGDERVFGFEYENEGTLAVDTRITYIVDYKAKGIVEPDTVIGMIADNTGDILTIIEGSENKATVESETIKGTKENVGLDSLKKEMLFKFRPEVANAFQDATFTIDVIIEGKQNRNNADWELMNTVSYKIHGNEVEVVEFSACNDTTVNIENDMFIYELRDEGVYVMEFNQPWLDEHNEGKRPNTIEIPEHKSNVPVVGIADNAFQMDRFESITLPNSIEYIGSDAFTNSKVTELNLPENLVHIGEAAFYNSELKDLTLPSNVETVGKEAFYSSPLRTLTLNEGLKSIGGQAFMSAKIDDLILPDSLESIGRNAFWSVMGGTVHAKQVRDDKYPTLRGYNFNSWTFKEIK